MTNHQPHPHDPAECGATDPDIIGSCGLPAGHHGVHYAIGVPFRAAVADDQVDEFRVPSYGIRTTVTTEEAERLEAEARVHKPWPEDAQPTVAQLGEWIWSMQSTPDEWAEVVAYLDELLTAADRGARCLDLGHEADLTYLGTVLDELAAARRRIHRLEHGHPADLAEQADDDTSGTLPTNPDQE